MSAAEQDAATPGAVGDGGHHDADGPVAPSAVPQTLTSLSALLGGGLEGGQACDADGNCD